jgi:hypothetical protein
MSVQHSAELLLEITRSAVIGQVIYIPAKPRNIYAIGSQLLDLANLVRESGKPEVLIRRHGGNDFLHAMQHAHISAPSLVMMMPDCNIATDRPS